MRGRIVWTTAAGLGLAAALGIATVAAAQEQSVSLTLASQNDSGISGTATISQTSDGKLTTYVACADIEMSGQQPATTGAAAPAALPATGSALPLDAAAVGLAGLGLTLAGLGLRRRRA